MAEVALAEDTLIVHVRGMDKLDSQESPGDTALT